MATTDTTPKSSASRLDVVAISTAIILSVSCLARGGVNDTVIAVMLMCLVPVLWSALESVGQLHHSLRRVGTGLLLTLLGVILLQYMLPANQTAPVWQQLESLAGHPVSSTLADDLSAFVQGLARLLLFTIVFIIALCIGTSESSARLFLHSLLMSGAFCLTLTFFIATDEGVPTSTFYSYTHGFVNPNNAAAYLGIMLLLAFAQAVRFIKIPLKNIHKTLPQMIDQLNMSMILNGGFIIYSVMLVLACLFMSGSRAGIFLGLLSLACFFIMIVMKLDLSSRMRRVTFLSGAMVMLIMLIWSFVNFGQIIVHKFSTDGISSNSRLDIFASVAPMIADRPLLGSGLGSFPHAFQQYRPQTVSSDGIIDKAHNSYLEFAAEMGLPALAALLAAFGWLGFVLFKGVRHRKERYVVPALGLSVWICIGMYSLVDFPLQIPGIMAIFIALTLVCASQADARFSSPSHSTNEENPTSRVRGRRRSTSAQQSDPQSH